jgi:prepilin-type N-terminal cleavage/methylation domain-containing protein
MRLMNPGTVAVSAGENEADGSWQTSRKGRLIPVTRNRTGPTHPAGFTLVEVLVSTAILGIGIAVLAGCSNWAEIVRQKSFAQEEALAAIDAQITKLKIRENLPERKVTSQLDVPTLADGRMRIVSEPYPKPDSEHLRRVEIEVVWGNDLGGNGGRIRRVFLLGIR